MPLLGEFLGTLVLILFGSGVVANVVLKGSKGENAGWITIATGWGIAVMIGVFVAQSAGSTQADINPAVSLAKFWMGTYTLPVLAQTAVAQLAGAFCGAVLVWLAYLPHWRETKIADNKLAVFCTQPAIRHWPSNLICEIIGTVTLIVGVGAIFGQATTGGPATGLGPYLVGMLVWGIGLSLGGPTGYAINPARDLGPRLAHALLPIPEKRNADWCYAWVPVVGPLIGGLIGACLWQALF